MGPLTGVATAKADCAKAIGLRPSVGAEQPGAPCPYRPEGVHITVRSLEGYVEDVPEDVVADYQQRITRLAAGLPAIGVEMRGVGASPSGVLAHGYPSPALDDLRQRLAQDAAAHPWAQARSGDANRVRNTAHATLLLFRPAPQPDPELAHAISKFKDHDFGSFETRAADLVTYRLSEDEIRVDVRARVEW